ncbi:MAG: hypothetical protein WA667_29880 [Candidatus Nitrosopolaris sp.]
MPQTPAMYSETYYIKDEHQQIQFARGASITTKSSVIANVILAPSSKLLVKVLGYLVF